MSNGSLQKANHALWPAARRGFIDRLPECLEEVCGDPLTMQQAARHLGLFWSCGHDTSFDANTFLSMIEFDKDKGPNGVHFMDEYLIPALKLYLETPRKKGR